MMFGQLSNRESLQDSIVALNAHRGKYYHLGMGKSVSKSSLARANQDRDYHIFEDYAYDLINDARKKRLSDIFKLDGNVYAFDSTTIDLYLSVFWWAKFRKKKGGIKVHTLYDVGTQIPACFHITEASVHNSTAMKEIPYQSESYYIFDCAYNHFKRLYKIHQIGAFCCQGKEKPSIQDNQMETQITQERSFRCWDDKQKRELVFLTNAIHISALQVAELYKNRWQVELFFKWLKQHLKIKKFWGTTKMQFAFKSILPYALTV